MKILVTGGKGFIGKALVKRLKKEGHLVETFDLVDNQELRYAEQVEEAVKGKDIVHHLAAVADLNWARIHPIETMEINIKGTWNVANSCQKYGVKLFYASTCCVYGNQEKHPVDEKTLPNPAEIYACSKLAGENIIQGYHLTYGLEYNLLRFATIYGPGVRPALGVHIFLGQAIRGEPITIHGDGKQTRTQTYIDDLIDGIIALQKSGKMNEAWNMTTEEEVSADEMAKIIKEITMSDSDLIKIPQRIGQTFRESVSAKKMEKEVSWKAKTSFKKGITFTYDWFTETNQKENIYIEPK